MLAGILVRLGPASFLLEKMRNGNWYDESENNSNKEEVMPCDYEDD